MSEVLLVLTLYCGAPVSATLAAPDAVRIWGIPAESRGVVMELAEKIRAGGGRVEFVHVEKQVEGVRCPVST